MSQPDLTELLKQASALEAGQRAALVQAVKEEHPALGSELEVLVQRLDRPLGDPDRAEGHAAAGPSREGSNQDLLHRIIRRDGDRPRYDQREEIARGAQGAILRVWDEELRRDLAMKVILDQRGPAGGQESVDGRALARFIDEAQVTGQLDHPGVVPVHELGIDSEGRIFFTMKLVKGRSFSRILELVRDESEGWTQTRALGVLQRICEAMAYAHSKQVIHRDLKPANVMVGRFGEVFVMDWGLAHVEGQEDRRDLRLRHTEPASFTQVRTHRSDGSDSGSPLLTMDGDVVGTPAYMSPEQANGAQELMGPPSDVYAVGAMLYQLLAGHMPYAPEGSRLDAYSIWGLVRTGPPPSLDSFARDAPPELVAICERAMQRQPEHRYPDMGAMAEDLKAYLEGRVVSAHRTGAFTELKKWVVRNRALAGAMAAAVLLLITGLATSLVFKARADDSAALAARRADETAKQAVLAEQRGEQALRNAYLGFLFAADAAVEQGNYEEARRMHLRCPEPHRGWEWQHLGLRLNLPLLSLEGHPAGIAAVACSPDGRTAVSAGRDGILRIWDVRSGEGVHELEGHTEEVYGAAYSPDGRRIISCSVDGTLRLWDARTGEVLRVLEGHVGTISSVAFRPDGAHILSGSYDGTTRVWDAETGDPVQVVRSSDEEVSAVRYSPDGSLFAVGTLEGGLSLLDVTTREEVLVLRESGPEVFSVAFSPNSQRVAAGHSDGVLRVWDVRTGEPLLEVEAASGGRSWVNSVTFSPDGGRLVSGAGDSTLRTFDAVSGRQLRSLPGHTEAVNAVAVSSDGEHLISGGADGALRIWDIRTSLASHELEVDVLGSEGAHQIALSPDGDLLVTGTADRPLCVWDTRTGELVRVLQARGVLLPGAHSIAFAPDGRRIAAGTSDNEIRICDVRTGEVLFRLSGHTARISEVAFSPDGRRLASGSFDGSVRIWDAESGEALTLLEGGGAGVLALTFSPDSGRLVTGGSGEGLRVHDLEGGHPVQSLVGEGAMVESATFSPDGSRIASLDGDRAIIVRDSRSGEVLQRLEGHAGKVLAVAFSPDGQRLASGARDGTLRIWDARFGETLQVLDGHAADVSSVVYGPEGHRLFSASRDGKLRIWESRLEDATPLWRALPQQAAAFELLKDCYAQDDSAESVITRLRADTSLPDALRQSAVRLAPLLAPSAYQLNERAWELVDPDREDRATDVALGLRLARRTVELDRQPEFLDTLAWALLASGLHVEAIEASTQALELVRSEQAASPSLVAQPDLEARRARIELSHRRLLSAVD